MKNRILTLLLVLLSSSSVSANWISADDFLAGQTIGQLSGVTIEGIQKASGSSTSEHYQSTIKELTFDPEQHKYFGNATYRFSLLLSNFLGHHNPLSSLDNIDSAAEPSLVNINFGGILLSLSEPIKSLGLKDVSRFGDGLVLFLFNKDGDYIKTTTNTPFSNKTTKIDSSDRTFWEFTSYFNFGTDVSYILIGSDDASDYITAFDISVPEPSSIMLLLVGVFSIFIPHALRRTW